jgi:predicted RND superfamily exporter protein
MSNKIFKTLDDAIINKSKLVIAIFLIITVILSFGIVQVSTDSGTTQFTEGISSVEALENINSEFQLQTLNTGSTRQTQLIQERRNVLSKKALLEQSKFEQEIFSRDEFRVTEVNSITKQVALFINPTATTPSERVNTLQRSTKTEISDATRIVLQNDALRMTVSNDYNSVDVTADKTISTTFHSPRGPNSGGPVAGTAGDSPVQDIQLSMADFAKKGDFSITVFGSGIQSNELGSVITDSLMLVIPAAVISIIIFLIISYRDPFDIMIGLISLLLVLIWTFGFMGWANIPFSQVLITVPPLLLAVGIDFGIHSVNRFREEFKKGVNREKAMIDSNKSLFVAFALVAGSTAIGFGSNIISPLQSLRDFSIVASIGIIFTFLVFGIFLPSLKLEIDRQRDKYDIYEFSSEPIGNEDSIIGKVLGNITKFNLKYPFVILLIVLVISTGAGMYAMSLDSEFSEETFLPPEELPVYIELAPVDINSYETPRIINLRKNNFEQFGESSLIIYVSDNLREDSSLEQLNRMGQNSPKNVIVRDEKRNVKQTSIISFIQSNSFSEETNDLIKNNDVNNNGIPDKNLDKIYDAIEDENPQSLLYITDKRSSARIIYTVDSSASTDEIISAGNTISNNTRLNAIPTGEAIVFNEVSNLLVDSTIWSLIVSILLTTIFVGFAYKYINGNYLVGIINIIPVIVSVIMLAATMRYLDIALNPITAINLATSIGIGLDYSIHLTHRISDEIETTENKIKSIIKSVQGTGGALFGSAITTVCGIGSLSLAIIPVLAEFGIIIGLGILYAFIFSILIIPPIYILILD